MSELSREIDALRQSWDSRLLVLGHHYEHDDVLAHADAVGDSLELAKHAAQARDVERIVFCGVHFMAETADMLTGPGQTVTMPDPEAGCPMADMATLDEARQAWELLGGGDEGWLPVCYVNSSAAIKAFCGLHGGCTCTSSNSAKVFDWVLGQGRRLFFLPDEHLGVNTAHDLGLADDEVTVYNPDAEGGGLDGTVRSRVVAWKGYCHVHTAFRTAQVENVRRRYPDARIIVHPEAPKEVVRLCDAHGSTSQIIRYVEDCPDGTHVFVGTEAHLVKRLAKRHAGRLTVEVLTHSICPNMAKTTEKKVLDVLKSWPEDREIHVPQETAERARRALERMLELS